MYRMYLKILGGLLVLAVVGGCSNDSEKLAQQTAVQSTTAQSDTINALRKEISSLSESVQTVNQQMAATNQRADSLVAENHQAAKNIASLHKKAKTMEEVYNSSLQELRASSTSEIAQRDSILAAINEIFSDTNTTLVSVREELGSTRILSDARANLIERIRPWYNKWKHDATKRSFIKVLFAAGKAPKPSFPEPNIDTTFAPASVPPSAPTPADTTTKKLISYETKDQISSLDE